MVQFPEKAQDFISLLRISQNVSVANLHPYSMGNRGRFLEGKSGRKVKPIITSSSSKVKHACRYNSAHKYAIIPCTKKITLLNWIGLSAVVADVDCAFSDRIQTNHTAVPHHVPRLTLLKLFQFPTYMSI